MSGLIIERFTKQLIMVIVATVVFAAMADDVCVPDISIIGEYAFGNVPLPNVPLKERDNIVGPEAIGAERKRRQQGIQGRDRKVLRTMLCGEKVERSDVERAKKELWSDVAFEEVYVQVSNRWACSVLTNQSCGTGLGECMIAKKDMMQLGGRTYSRWRLQAGHLVWFNLKRFVIGDLTAPYPYGQSKTDVIFGRNWSNEYGVAVQERNVYSSATKLSGLVYQIHMRETLATNRIDGISFGRWMDAIASKVSMACGEQFCKPSFVGGGLFAKCTSQTYELEIKGEPWDWMDSKCVRIHITLSLRRLLQIAQDEDETLKGFASNVKAQHPSDADILKKCREYEEIRSRENAELERIEAMQKPYEVLSLNKSGLEKLANIKFAGFEFGGDGLITLKSHETQDKIRIKGKVQPSQNRLGSSASQTPREKCFDSFLSMGSNDCLSGWMAYGNFRHTCVTKRLYKVHLVKDYSGIRCRQICEQDLDKIVSCLEQENGAKMIAVDQDRPSKQLTYLSDIQLCAKKDGNRRSGFLRRFLAKTKNRLNVEICAARVARCNGVPCDKISLSVTITSPDFESLAVLECEERRQRAE